MSPTPARPNTVNSSPRFETADGWGPGFALAKDHGSGVVVGPGSTNPNVFAQPFVTTWGEQFQVTARASSVDKVEGTAAIQINWFGKQSKFISSSQQYFKVTPQEKTFHHNVTAPWGARHGVLYVVPGGPADVVRYTEMTLSRLQPLDDFMAYRFAGLTGQNILALATAILVLAVFYSFYRRQLSKVGAFFIRIFPLLALVLCGAIFVFMEGHYEQHYDSQWHQGSIETLMRWKDVSMELGGSPLHNFGVQQVINPLLSPTFWIGLAVPADHRIQAEAAFQAMVLFAILLQICRLAGARLPDASAMSLIAVFYLWIPDLSNGAISLNATLGLLWQEGLLGTLLAFFCFALIGYGGLQRRIEIWPIAGFVATVVWFYLAWPELIIFFTLATAGLCLGAIIGIESKRELLGKLGVAAALAAGLLLAGFHNYVLNLFLYTPQMYYRTLYNHDFGALFLSNTSLLLALNRLGGAKLAAFFVFAILGAFFALRYGNSFARRVVFGALSLELAIHGFSAINRFFKLVPLTFTYVEQMGFAIVALLAGTGVWATLQLTSRMIAKGYTRVASLRSATRQVS